jgi:hypothetical protein
MILVISHYIALMVGLINYELGWIWKEALNGTLFHALPGKPSKNTG